jgi:tetratricopeptide (TPR) repeat protein
VRANVLTDAALTRQAGRFVWLSIDTEKAKNAEFVKKYPINGWPSFLVVDAEAEAVVLRWYGGASVQQMAKLMDDGEQAWRAPKGNTPEALLARADRLNGERKYKEAAEAYEAALKSAPATWPRRGRTIESLVMALNFERDRERCVRVAMEHAPKMERNTSFANTVYFGLNCSLGAPDEMAGWRNEGLAKLRSLGEEALRLPTVVGDDRSGLYEMMINVADAQRDHARVKKLAAEWFEFLEQERKRGATAEARAAIDGHRVTAALRLGAPARAVPALQASEKELPDDYNPPARLAVLYREMGRHDDALAASDRALAKAYGPRKIGIYTARVEIYRKKGDSAAARKTLEQAIQFAETLPQGKEQADRLRQQLAQLR